jgi:hypothetical protein
MTTHGNGPPRLYVVRFVGTAKEQVKQRFREALHKGNEKRYIAALRTIIEQLKRQPVTFGEPLYRLPALQMVVYHAAVAPVAVDYGVHEQQPFVFIRGVQAMS